MARETGLGDHLWIAGRDISGDVGAVQSIKDETNLLDFTGIDKSATERRYGLNDGELSFNVFFNSSLLQEHSFLKTLPRSDTQVEYWHGGAIGNPMFGMKGLELDYAWDRSADAHLKGVVTVKADPFGLEWGEQLTAGKRTDVAATLGTGLNGGTQAAAVSITSVAVSNPGQVNATAHGLITGDSVVIAGTATTPSINNQYTVTVVNANQFTIPVNVTSGQAGAGGTVTKTSTDFGLSAYLQVFSFTGTDATVKLQDSADDASYADLTNGAFTQITSGPGVQRIQTSLTGIIRRYVRVTTTTVGGFNPMVFTVGFVRYSGARPQ